MAKDARVSNYFLFVLIIAIKRFVMFLPIISNLGQPNDQ